MKWYMITTIGKLENKAKESIEQSIRKQKKEALFGEILVPEIDETKVVKGVKVTKKIALYPNYILVQMVPTDESMMIVKGAKHVVGFVGGTKVPVPLTEAEIEKIKNLITGTVAKVAAKEVFVPGENVKIEAGPFSGFEGVVEDTKPEKAKVVVNVSIFGRPTPVELDYNQVTKA